MNVLSKEDLRKRRLAALGASDDDSNDGSSAKMISSQQQKVSSSTDASASTAFAPEPAENVQSSVAVEDTSRARIQILSSAAATEGINDFLSLMWGVACSSEDQERWYNQGINFSHDESFPWGLVQQFGGPCGVLACVQAELLYLLLFDTDTSTMTAARSSHVDNENESMLPQLKNLSEKKLELLLAKAIARLLLRACTTKPNKSQNSECHESLSINIALPKYINEQLLELNEAFIKILSIPIEKQVETDMFIKEITDVLLTENTDEVPIKPLTLFQQPGGVVLLACSMVLSRGSKRVKADMDDPSTCHLTGQFGHCSQELINLFLTGNAVSNVFDNVIDMGSGYVVKGIPSRPRTGYLTQLEALRYCEVGSYFKTPHTPIWVIGSSSHFSILFSPDFTCIEQSQSDELLDKCRRSFRICDPDSNGFIQVESLGNVLSALDSNIIKQIGGESGVQALGAKLEVSGAEIILWDDFWKACSRLMTGASLQNVLVNDNQVLEGMTKNGSSSISASPVATSEDPDEQYARELQAQFDSETAQDSFNSKHHIKDRTSEQAKSDEELARELQAKFDKGDIGDDSSIPPLESISPSPDDNDNASTTALADGRNSLSVFDDTASPISSRLPSPIMGDTFSLFYYNGLRGGILQSFDVTRLTSEEAVGASIALHSGSGGVDGSNYNNALEDVVRTRWPSCAFNWKGKIPPAID